MLGGGDPLDEAGDRDAVLIDDRAGLTRLAHTTRRELLPRIRGASEETTSGVAKFSPTTTARAGLSGGGVAGGAGAGLTALATMGETSGPGKEDAGPIGAKPRGFQSVGQGPTRPAR